MATLSSIEPPNETRVLFAPRIASYRLPLGSSLQFPYSCEMAISCPLATYKIGDCQLWDKQRSASVTIIEGGRTLASRSLKILLCIYPVAMMIIISSVVAKPATIGWIEEIKIAELGVPIKAKIDTGANTSSLGVTKVELFKKNGNEWVRFFVQGPMPEQIMLERRIFRWTKIRRTNTQLQRRPVVILPTCLGGHYKQTQFTLETRDSMNFAVLIGRRFLDDKFLVTAGKTYVSKPECTGKPLPNTPNAQP